jgi:ketosteroid isomerase-like protein
MSNENVDLIRKAYEAYARGDVATMLQFVGPDLEWARYWTQRRLSKIPNTG